MREKTLGRLDRMLRQQTPMRRAAMLGVIFGLLLGIVVALSCLALNVIVPTLR